MNCPLYFLLFLQVIASGAIFVPGPCPKTPPTQSFDTDEIYFLVFEAYLERGEVAPKRESILFHEKLPKQLPCYHFQFANGILKFFSNSTSRDFFNISSEVVSVNDNILLSNSVSFGRDFGKDVNFKKTSERVWVWKEQNRVILFSCYNLLNHDVHDEGLMVGVPWNHSDVAHEVNETKEIVRKYIGGNLIDSGHVFWSELIDYRDPECENVSNDHIVKSEKKKKKILSRDNHKFYIIISVLFFLFVAAIIVQNFCKS